MPDKQSARFHRSRAAKQLVRGHKYRPNDHPDTPSESAAEASTSARPLSSSSPPPVHRPRKRKTLEEKYGSVTLDTYELNRHGERRPRERRCITSEYDVQLPCAFPGCDWCEWSCVRCVTGTKKQPCVSIEGRRDTCAKCMTSKTPGSCSWKIWKPKEERFHPLPNGAILSKGPNKGERQYWYAFFGEDGPKTIEWDGTMVSRGLRPTDCPESGYKRTAPGFASEHSSLRSPPQSVHRDDAPSRAPDSDDELFMLSPHSFDLPPLHHGVELIFEAEHGDEEEEELFRLSPHNFVLLPYADAQRDNGVGPVEPADDAYDADVKLFRLRPIVLGPVDAV